MKTKTVGSRSTPKSPEGSHTLGAKVDPEAKLLKSNRPRGVFKFRTWEDKERWEQNRTIGRAGRMPTHCADQPPSTESTAKRTN